MRQAVIDMTVVVTVIAMFPAIGLSQQPPRRSVVYTFQYPTVTKTQWTNDPASLQPANLVPGAGSASSNSVPGLLQPVSSQPTGMNQPNSLMSLNPTPTNQQIQNPSGALNLTHNGMSQAPYTSTNTYFGSQFNNWSNLQVHPSTLDQWQTYNRTWPPVNSGAYYSPNTYFGSANTQWSNLSSGSPTANYLGGYIYQR